MSHPTEIGPENEALNRRYGDQGQGIVTLATDLFPTVDMGRMPFDMEFLRGSHIVSTSVQSPGALPGSFPFVQIRNPTNSGAILTVTRISFQVFAPAAVPIAVFGAMTPTIRGATVFRSQATDSRWLTTLSTATVSFGVNTLILPSPTQFQFIKPGIIADPPIIIDEPRIVLHAGSQFEIGVGVDLCDLWVNLSWIERRAGKWEVPA